MDEVCIEIRGKNELSSIIAEDGMKINWTYFKNDIENDNRTHRTKNIRSLWSNCARPLLLLNKDRIAVG